MKTSLPPQALREIKFRAWDKNEMRHFSLNTLLDGYNDDCASPPNGENPSVVPLWMPVMQFTGLQDQNGVDIYEGDILIVNTSGVDEKWASIEVVEWDEAWCGFGPLCYLSYHGGEEKYCIVIGNIHKPPELLK